MSNALPEGWLTRTSRYFIDHISGKWRISKSMVKGKSVYTLWKRVEGKWALYGNHDSVEIADEYRQNNQQKRST